MKPKLLLGLVLVTYQTMCACADVTNNPPNGTAHFQRLESEQWKKEQSALDQGELPAGKFLESHTLKDHPTVMIYMQGFLDSSFKAILKDGGKQTLLFRSLATDNFESLTNSIVRDNKAKRFAPETAGTFDVYWSTNAQRLAIAYRGNFIAGYDGKTGQKIQVDAVIDVRQASTAVGTVINKFLDGKDFTEAEVKAIRTRARREHYRQLNP